VGRSGKQVHVVGTRPNFVKAAPVVRALLGAGSGPVLVHTGQHFHAELSAIFFTELGLPTPDHDLGVGSGSQAVQTAHLLMALERLMMSVPTSRVVVYGDVNSTLAAALVAAKLEIPVAHVEAGLRSFDRSMPEEINRVVTDSIANLHFVTSPEGLGHLAREGISAEAMHFVGNPMIDTLLRFRDVLDPADIKKRLGVDGEYGVVTLHRPSNVDDDTAARRVVEGLRRAAKHVPLVAPLHPRGRERLEALGLGEHVHIIDPLGYLDFMALVMGSSVVLTDSGGIQEETTVLGIPCVTLRDNTERPITITMGTNRLVGNDPDSIEAAVLNAPDHTSRQVPPLWDGHASDRIAHILIEQG
jgi:UDP-N-acetylglucosamine 2-epimerase (non-hydrolysing)